MKRLLIVFFMIAYSSAHAQFIESYGIKFGGTISHQEWSPMMPGSNAKENKFGMNIGAYAEFTGGPVFSIVTEINYIQKGFIEKYYLPPSSHKIQIDYLNLSLLAKSKYDLGVIKPYLLLGPRIDYELNKTNSMADYDFRKCLFGFEIGIGSEFEIFQIRLLGELLYDYGFGDMNIRDNVETKVSSYDFRIGIVL